MKAKKGGKRQCWCTDALMFMWQLWLRWKSSSFVIVGLVTSWAVLHHSFLISVCVCEQERNRGFSKSFVLPRFPDKLEISPFYYSTFFSTGNSWQYYVHIWHPHTSMVCLSSVKHSLSVYVLDQNGCNRWNVKGWGFTDCIHWIPWSLLVYKLI